MKIIALFLALGLERLASQLFHWRELRWLDPLFDVGLRYSSRAAQLLPYAWVVLTLAVAVAPVFLLRTLLVDTLLGLPYLLLCIAVLFLCLGPQDIGEDADRWCRAVAEGDAETERMYAHALLERGFSDAPSARPDVPGAVFVQANNRMFAVIFWFVILGPVGAWLFRASDLLRRRALFQAQRNEPDAVIAPDCEQRATAVHALLAWLPARLSALGYTLAGSFDAGRDAWQRPQQTATLAEGNDALLQRVGVAAMALMRTEGEPDQGWYMRAVRAAKSLALRTLWFWLVGVAVLTLVGFAV